MNNMINQKTREESTQNNPFIQAYLNGQITEKDIPALQAKYGGGEMGTQEQGIVPNLQRGATTAGNIFLQGAGLNQPKNTANDLNSLMMKEYVKNMYKPEKAKTIKEQLYEGVTTGNLPEGVSMDEAKKALGMSDTAREKMKIQQEEKTTLKNKISDNIKSQAQDALGMIDEAKRGINYFGAGSLIPAIPTLQGKKTLWQTNIDRLLSTRVIDLMNQMKAASRTGATGFGQLNKSELDLLKNAATTLKKTLSPEDALRYLNQMERMYRKIVDGGGETPTYSIGDTGNTPPQAVGNQEQTIYVD